MPIKLDAFKKLPVVDIESKKLVAKVSTAQLLTKLGEEAMSTKEVAAYCGVKTGTAHTRLVKLEAKGAVERRQGEGKQFWAKNPKYVPRPEDEKDTEEGDEEFEDEDKEI